MSDITPSDQLVEQASASPIEAGAQGLMSALNGYLGTTLSNQQDVEKQKQVAQNQHDIDHPPQPDYSLPMDPAMAEKALPGYGGKMVADYNKLHPQTPLTVTQASDYIGKAQTLLNANNPDTTKIDAHQDTLEKQAQDRITQVRGDQSLMRTEAQRDASGMAYETIAKAQSENRHLSSVEYNDLAAQLWKARTGSSVTSEELKKLAPQTAQTSADHLAAWASGNPNLIGATSTDTENNLKQFVVSSGQKADQQRDAYMSPRLVKPTGLEQSRWDRIAAASRGMSFAEQKSVSDKTHKVKAYIVTPASVRAKLGI
jgi:hypothetical protein